MKASYGGKERFVRFVSVPGISDIIGLLPVKSVAPLSANPVGGLITLGRFIAVETKVHPNTPTTAQTLFLESVRAHGGIGVVIYDVADLASVLRECGCRV